MDQETPTVLVASQSARLSAERLTSREMMDSLKAGWAKKEPKKITASRGTVLIDAGAPHKVTRQYVPR